MVSRHNGRCIDQLRPINVSYDVFSHAVASVLFELGKTKVLCAITLQNTVPHFLKGKKTGWLTAEYAMLPTATHMRIERETTACKRNGRAIEISRMIGRALRPIVQLDKLGERTITVDCDVLQADGSTRTACISGAFLALSCAEKRWIKAGILEQTILNEDVSAVSIGISQDNLLLDLDFAEDSIVDADFNFVITGSGKVIEVQGTAEHQPFEWQVMNNMYALAKKGVNEILQYRYNDHVDKKPFNHIRVKETVK